MSSLSKQSMQSEGSRAAKRWLAEPGSQAPASSGGAATALVIIPSVSLLQQKHWRIKKPTGNARAITNLPAHPSTSLHQRKDRNNFSSFTHQNLN